MTIICLDFSCRTLCLTIAQSSLSSSIIKILCMIGVSDIYLADTHSHNPLRPSIVLLHFLSRYDSAPCIQYSRTAERSLIPLAETLGQSSLLQSDTDRCCFRHNRRKLRFEGWIPAHCRSIRDTTVLVYQRYTELRCCPVSYSLGGLSSGSSTGADRSAASSLYSNGFHQSHRASAVYIRPYLWVSPFFKTEWVLCVNDYSDSKNFIQGCFAVNGA